MQPQLWGAAWRPPSRHRARALWVPEKREQGCGRGLRPLTGFLGRQGLQGEHGLEGLGLDNPRQRPELGVGGPPWPTTHHFHIFPREVLDFLLHPLDAVQQVLILLVHSLVLLHQGLQLDLGLPGAFQLRSERHGRPVALRPSELLTSHHGGRQGSSLGLPGTGAATVRTTFPGCYKPQKDPKDTWLPNTVSYPRLRGLWGRQEEEAAAQQGGPQICLRAPCPLVPTLRNQMHKSQSSDLAAPGHHPSPSADLAETLPSSDNREGLGPTHCQAVCRDTRISRVGIGPGGDP